MEDFFRKINDYWFLTEPLLFPVLCTHRLVKNNKLSIPMRTGEMRIEYNPAILQQHKFEEVQELLKIEMIRVVLKHPYQRQPYKADKTALGISSMVTIAENYDSFLPLPEPKDFDIPSNLSFEEYYKIFFELLKNMQCSCTNAGSNSSCSNSERSLKDYYSLDSDAYGELTALWGEDNLGEQMINDFIRQAKENNSWGSLSGNMVDLIEASLIVKLDYRRILNSFRASVLSSQRRLTRMRPSRRYGFQYMGSKREFTTKLLVAVDVSGSVTDEDLQNFFSVVNRFFKYGIQQIDVLQFDVEITGELLSLKKAKKSMKILGRGGTSFQPVFDYVCDNPFYDGLIIFTDGYAPEPVLKRPVSTRILWILDNEDNYNQHQSWIEALPKSHAVWIE